MSPVRRAARSARSRKALDTPAPPQVNTKASRADCLAIGKVAEAAERWDDVIAQVKNIISYSNAHLNIEERNLLSVAYKNKTGALRTSWRTVDTLAKHAAALAAAGRNVPLREQALLRRQREKIEGELAAACEELLDMLKNELVPAAGVGEERVFYYKMQGDYYRYVTEFSTRPPHAAYATRSLDAYTAAYKHAVGTLAPWHPTRLGLALNFAVFFRDVRASPERACHLAKHAFDEAVARLDELDAMPEQTVKDAVMILQLLRDDLILWSGEMATMDREEEERKQQPEKR
ncbi:14-3-3 protein [Auriscalpium vulgare]|uniref:14-3-3 protein n=1 Tax=Auriscalpium vulgare TaxID=40419 RepID=A0ACB8RHT9_9AGAM|nr:14-3-3 protein [Auriscalpium vulgare]